MSSTAILIYIPCIVCDMPFVGLINHDLIDGLGQRMAFVQLEHLLVACFGIFLYILIMCCICTLLPCCGPTSKGCGTIIFAVH